MCRAPSGVKLSFMDGLWMAIAAARMALGHGLADGLQGRLSGLKRRVGIDGKPKRLLGWLPYLGLHGAAHGLAVGWALGCWWAGLAEALAHMGIDFLKCEGRYGSLADQALHAGCKIAWLALVVTQGHGMG